MRALRLCWFVLLIVGIATAAQSQIVRVEINTSINPISRNLIVRTIREAEAEDASLIIIELNTPGGLDQSTRDIVAAQMASTVPIAVFVSPSGARAASAGTFIMLAADVAAMAPGTNIGAAHPVNLLGRGEADGNSTSMEKAANDAAAFARSIAEKQGRNVDWAEAAVLESRSLSASEALAAGVIDLIVEDLPALLSALDSREVKGRRLSTLQATVRTIQPNWQERLLGMLADPNLVYVLFILGVFGLIFEFFHPGVGFGLAAGGLCLILALFGLQVLPVDVTGMILILFGAGLMVLDAFTPTNGILTLGGVIALLIGSLTLFETPDGSVAVSLGVIFTVIALTAAFSIFILSKAWMIQRKKPTTGIQTLVGMLGVVRRALQPQGIVRIRGEYWNARAIEGTIQEGERVTVEALDERTLLVRRTYD